MHRFGELVRYALRLGALRTSPCGSFFLFRVRRCWIVASTSHDGDGWRGDRSTSQISKVGWFVRSQGSDAATWSSYPTPWDFRYAKLIWMRREIRQPQSSQPKEPSYLPLRAKHLRCTGRRPLPSPLRDQSRSKMTGRKTRTWQSSLVRGHVSASKFFQRPTKAFASKHITFCRFSPRVWAATISAAYVLSIAVGSCSRYPLLG